MRVAIALLLSVLWCHSVFATPQTGDILLVLGAEHRVHGVDLPKSVLERLSSWKKKRKQTSLWSNNWKGYFARLSIVDKQLFLDRIEVDRGPDLMTVPLPVLFGTAGPVKVAWFSGELCEYLGQPVGYTHFSQHARIYRFKSGVLVDVEKRTWR